MESHPSELQASLLPSVYPISPPPPPPPSHLGLSTKPCACLPQTSLSVQIPALPIPYPQSSPTFPLLRETVLAQPLSCTLGTCMRDSRVLGACLCFALFPSVLSRELQTLILFMQTFPPNVIKTKITHRRKCSYILFIISSFETRASP